MPEQDRGDAFEVFAEAYFNTQKIAQAQEVWPFDAIPLSIRPALGFSDRDMGVDGLIKTHEDEYHAYQVKYRSARMALSWQETSTFMGLSDHANKRILFTNSDGIPAVLNKRSDFYVIAGNDLDKLETRDFEAIEQWLAGSKVTHVKKQPLPHQIAALHDIQTALDQADRATAVMACATGKTLVSLWLAEQRNAQSILVLLPSLALVRQTLHCWIKETAWNDFSFLCVCSDATVLKSDNDAIQLHQADCDFPVTTNAIDIEKFLNAKSSRRKIIFSTYQSCKMIPEGYTFDLGIFDEAHKTAGREGTNFSYALADKNISIAKRLFLTATPRHYNINKKDKEGNLQVVFSMDDANVYGQICHKLSFASAAKQDIICKYKVLISLVTSEMIDRELLKHGEVIINGDPIKAHRVANLLALTNAVERYGVKRIFTFHNAVKAAQSFTADASEGIATFLNDFATFHVNGEMPTSKRELLMQEFKAAPKAVMSNARCLTEGVDVPAVDMVAFISPKKSQIDIIQATGRAMRKADGKECGYILIPIFLELASEESIEQALDKTRFVEVWNVLQTLQEYDENLVEIISQMLEDKGRTGGFDDSRLREKIEFLGPEVQLSVLRNAITTKIVEKLGATWDERFGELVQFKELNGHCHVPPNYPEKPTLGTWISNQRADRKSGVLSPKRIERLDEIGFIWDMFEATWEENYSTLCEFKKINGHCNVPKNHSEKPMLGTWVTNQRTNRKNKDLSLNRIKRLDEIGFIWNMFEIAWEENYSALCEFKKINGHCNVPKRYSKLRSLGSWVGTQRKKQNKKELSQEYVNRLNKIGFIWDPYDTAWEENYSALCEFKQINGHCNVPNSYSKNPTLGTWVGKQRIDYRKEILSQDRIKKLNAIGFVWDPIDAAWEENYSALCEFRQINGHCNIPQRYSENRTLGTWVGRQRANSVRKTLSQNRIKRLDAIGFLWDLTDVDWEEKYSALCEFKQRNGHCNVPVHYPEDPLLGIWVRTQRANYNSKKEYLTQKRIQFLNKIGFDWDTLNTKWEQRFDDLCNYKKQNGDCNVPKTYPKNPTLARWVGVQRQQYKNNNLSVQRIAKLNGLEFNWGSKKRWHDSFIELQNFKKTFGHCIVPQNYPGGLGYWTSKQRNRYNNKNLSQERVSKLVEMGFVWDPIKAAWEEKYATLCKFKEINGHCRIPQNYPPDPSLPGWVSKQREEYRNNQLKTERIKTERILKLESIGFIWDPLNAAWEEKYFALCEFKKLNGHCNVPRGYPDHPALERWVSKQRQKYDNEDLSQEQIKKLNEIGFK